MPARFHFNRSEQLLLQHALMGETSEQLAASLCISPWTVKKRWHAIYERVTDVDRELLLPPVANSPDATSRGTERRRHLLHYLRQHLEELRPFEPMTHGFGTHRSVEAPEQELRLNLKQERQNPIGHEVLGNDR